MRIYDHVVSPGHQQLSGIEICAGIKIVHKRVHNTSITGGVGQETRCTIKQSRAPGPDILAFNGDAWAESRCGLEPNFWAEATGSALLVGGFVVMSD